MRSGSKRWNSLVKGFRLIGSELSSFPLPVSCYPLDGFLFLLRSGWRHDPEPDFIYKGVGGRLLSRE